MRRRPDHAVIKRKSQPLHGRKMGVDDRGIRAVGIAQGVKEPLGLGFKILFASYGKQIFLFKEGAFLVITEQGAILFTLLLL